jgi:cytidylate kinase
LLGNLLEARAGDVRTREDEKKRGLVIAVDGPSGVGKSTISRALAERVGCRYIDTGAMYRAVALLARQQEVSLDDPEGLARVGRGMEIEFVETAEGPGVRLGGEDVALALRMPGVSDEASRLSRFPEVREVLVEKQREIGEQGKVVMEGRDIGTVVLPEADLKIYLEAEPEERARRRYFQWKEKGIEVPQEQLSQEIRDRDQRDQTRKVAPLVPARDAAKIDTTHLDPAEVLDRILALLSDRGLLEEEGER